MLMVQPETDSLVQGQDVDRLPAEQAAPDSVPAAAPDSVFRRIYHLVTRVVLFWMLWFLEWGRHPCWTPLPDSVAL